jgi:hypothetical protein
MDNQLRVLCNLPSLHALCVLRSGRYGLSLEAALGP